VEVMASLSQGRTAAAQCGLFTHKSVPVIFEPPCTYGQMVVEASSFSSFIRHVNLIELVTLKTDDSVTDL